MHRVIAAVVGDGVLHRPPAPRVGDDGEVLPDDQQLEARSISFPSPSSLPAMADFKEFMVGVEEGFITDLMAFLKSL